MLERIKTFAIGVAIGSSVGAALSVLLTPDSGENLRHKTKEYYQYLLDESTKAAEARRLELHQELAALTAPATEQQS